MLIKLSLYHSFNLEIIIIPSNLNYTRKPETPWWKGSPMSTIICSLQPGSDSDQWQWLCAEMCHRYDSVSAKHCDEREVVPQTQRKSQNINTLGPRQKGRHFADDIFKCIFLNESVWISINISLKFVPYGQINNIAALVQIMSSHCLKQWCLTDA